MRNPDLSVGLLARELAMGRTLIFRKLKAVTGLTPNDFMKLIRLNEAKRMIIEGRYRITEIGFLTGFSSSSYFAKCFAKQFGVLPTEFLENRNPEHSSQGQPFLNFRCLGADFIVKVNDIFQRGIPDSVILHRIRLFAISAGPD